MATRWATCSTACRWRRARRSRSPSSTGTAVRARRDEESLEERETLNAFLNRDRDISEIANASVRESMAGGSEASTELVRRRPRPRLHRRAGRRSARHRRRHVGGELVGVAELGTQRLGDLAPAAARPHRARGVGGAQPALHGRADGPPGRDDAGRRPRWWPTTTTATRSPSSTSRCCGTSWCGRRSPTCRSACSCRC